jgi:hypothetical protein
MKKVLVVGVVLAIGYPVPQHHRMGIYWPGFEGGTQRVSAAIQKKQNPEQERHPALVADVTAGSAFAGTTYRE